MSNQDDKIRNPVEEYMREIMDLDKPDKPPETTAEPANALEVKSSSSQQQSNPEEDRQEAVKVADALKQSVSINRSNQGNKPPETQIFNTRKHPIGLVYMYVLAVVSYAFIFSMISLLLPGFADITGLSLDVVGPIAGILMIAALVVGAVFIVLASRAYMFNRLILTDENITQNFQVGLRARDTMQLPLSDIEAANIHKEGPLAKMFNYGTITVETLNKKNLTFNFAPNPEICVKAIQDTRMQHLGRQNTTL